MTSYSKCVTVSGRQNRSKSHLRGRAGKFGGLLTTMCKHTFVYLHIYTLQCLPFDDLSIGDAT